MQRTNGASPWVNQKKLSIWFQLNNITLRTFGAFGINTYFLSQKIGSVVIFNMVLLFQADELPPEQIAGKNSQF